MALVDGAAYERAMAEITRLTDDLANMYRLRRECVALADDLADELAKARDMVADWASYADDYYKEKWNLAADLGHIDAVLAGYEKARGR